MTHEKKFNFEYPELSQIHGEPNHVTILNLTKEVKANLQSQRSAIGGGHYGYLWMIMPEDEFRTLPHTEEVVVPVATQPFTVPIGTSAVQSMIEKSQWDTDTTTYLEYVQMQLAIKNQISQAIGTRYLKALRNPVTNSITRSVMDIITFLKSRYVRVNIIQLSEAESALKALVYDLQDPIDEAIFERIDDHAEIADMASVPISERQKIDLAMLIIIKSKKFTQDIRTWNARPAIDKTWELFKDYFRNAYDAMRDLGDLTMDQSPVLNQAQLMESIMLAMHRSAAAEDAMAFDSIIRFEVATNTLLRIE